MRWVAIAGVVCGIIGFATALGAMSAAHAERDRVSQHNTRLDTLRADIDDIRKTLDEIKTGQTRYSDQFTALQTRVENTQRTLVGIVPVASAVTQLQRDVADLKTAAEPPPAKPVVEPPAPSTPPASQPASPKKPETTPKKPDAGKPTKTPKKSPK